MQNRLKKRLTDLTSQLNTYKQGKKMLNNLEDHKIEFEINSARNRDDRNKDFENKSQIIDTKCNTYQRYKKISNISNTSRAFYLGTTNKKVGDVRKRHKFLIKEKNEIIKIISE